MPILIFLISISTYGQYYADIDISKAYIFPWNSSKKGYQARYRFGVSEGESELRLIVDGTVIVAQTKCRVIDTATGGFKDVYNTFTNVRIEGNKFYSDQTNGEFVTLKLDLNNIKGLLVHNPWTYKFNNRGEFGRAIFELISFKKQGVHLDGEYAASTRILTEQELEQYSLAELEIMRNEIFARYDFNFEKTEKCTTIFLHRNGIKEGKTKKLTNG